MYNFMPSEDPRVNFKLSIPVRTAMNRAAKSEGLTTRELLPILCAAYVSLRRDERRISTDIPSMKKFVVTRRAG